MLTMIGSLRSLRDAEIEESERMGLLERIRPEKNLSPSSPVKKMIGVLCDWKNRGWYVLIRELVQTGRTEEAESKLENIEEPWRIRACCLIIKALSDNPSNNKKVQRLREKIKKHTETLPCRSGRSGLVCAIEEICFIAGDLGLVDAEEADRLLELALKWLVQASESSYVLPDWVRFTKIVKAYARYRPEKAIDLAENHFKDRPYEKAIQGVALVAIVKELSKRCFALLENKSY